MLTKKLISFLKKYDTPTISNALDIYRNSRSADGYTKYPFISANNKLEPIIGIARTAKIKAGSPPTMTPDQVTSIRINYYEYMSNTSSIHTEAPNVCIIEDLDWPNPTGSFWGEVNVALHQGLGLAGTITSGLLRDLDAIDKGYQVLANGIGPSHAYVHVLEYGSSINIHGLHVNDGDIIHADQHGVVLIPSDALPMIERGINYMTKKEKHLIDAAKQPNFNIEKLKIAWQNAANEKWEGWIMFEIDKNARRLSQSEKQQYLDDGYVTGLPVFSKNAINDIHDWYEELSSKLPKEIDINKTNMWHKASKKFYDLCRTPTILDYVEDLIGPNFVQWGGQFFSKEPRDGSVVPWHQDAQYWPLSPANAVTVWLAVFDTDEENAAMKVVSGSHKLGKFVHKKNDAKNLVLNQEVSFDQLDKTKIVSLNLKAGQISLHNDALLHGSEANNSNRRRCGVTMRFSPTNVKGDLKTWPFFETQLARGSWWV